MKMTKEQKLENLTAAIREFYDPIYLNKWVSVKERSVTSILRRWGFTSLYGPAMYQVLVDHGLLEREGIRGCMQYKITSDSIKDAEILANEVLLKFNESKQKSGYSETSKISDLMPKQRSHSKDKNEEIYSSKPQIQHKEPLKLNDVRYIMYNNSIYEGRIISLYLREDDISKDSIYCDVEISTSSDMKRVVYALRTNKLFSSAENLLFSLNKHLVKYKR